MIDVERVVAKRLMDATGIRAVLEVPEERPEEFLSVELTGTGTGLYPKTCSLAVQSWAKTRRRAAEIAGLVEVAIYGLTEEPNVFKAVPDGTYRWPDPDSRQERYQTNAELTICE
ncbi:hypothetical protein [Collinsella bouchesdurhonensis]|uniref:hypothetical protein n=1 Tax=Collinsella bouchesdurhonensis TaxID=1907654 RepID=UPI00096A7CF2|nr:hypothetical protein [Collinsella bouchesdurhonensis]